MITYTQRVILKKFGEYKMENERLDHTDDQFLISPELLQLMDWIVRYEPEALKRIVARAVKQGLKNNKPENPPNGLPELEELQRGFVDFISLMEYLLHQVTDERALKSALQANLLPALDHIDAAACDVSTIKSSLAGATSQMERNPEANPKELLFKELLKRWNPHKKHNQH